MRNLSPSALLSKPNQPFLPEANKQTSEFRARSGIEDDHIPFMARGVEILHIIPTPFPRVWHTPSDDGAHLDGDTVQDWARMVTAFVGEWMDLEGFFPSLEEAEKKMEEMRAKVKRNVERKDEL